MAQMHGKLAKILWDANGDNDTLQLSQSWSCTLTHQVSEVTAMQDSWKTYLTGFQDWTATVTCLEDSAGPDISPIGGAAGAAALGDTSVAKLELYFKWDDQTPLYRAMYGTAICTGFTEGADAQGIPTVTYTFQGNDQLQWYTSGATEPSY